MIMAIISCLVSLCCCRLTVKPPLSSLSFNSPSVILMGQFLSNSLWIYTLLQSLIKLWSWPVYWQMTAIFSNPYNCEMTTSTSVILILTSALFFLSCAIKNCSNVKMSDQLLRADKLLHFMRCTVYLETRKFCVVCKTHTPLIQRSLSCCVKLISHV